jgi:DNA-binding winged helix-turn-helix (wHTH) protein
MKTQRIVHDIAERPGASFEHSDSIASIAAVVKHRVPSASSNMIEPLENGTPASLRNMAELKLQIDGLPVLIRFPIGDLSKKTCGCRVSQTDIHSLLSTTLEKIIDGIRGSTTRPAVSGSAPTIIRTSVETRSGPSEAQTMLRVGPLELNLLDRTAKRGERRLDLRPREFRLLRYMMERSDKVLTRAELLQKVWNYKFVPQTNLVDVHMGRLRRTVDGPNEPMMIRSVRGSGFILNANPLPQN